MHGIGRCDEAVQVVERLLGLRNDVSLLSEEYDPHSRRQLGNTPQAFSLMSLINTARHLSGSHPATSAPRSGVDELAADASVAEQLITYRHWFSRSFLIRAADRSRDAIATDLCRRLTHSPEEEDCVIAAELAQIALLRLLHLSRI